MRTRGRRAAIGATTLALLLAATGTSLAAVRAARYQGGVTGSSLAIPVHGGGLSDRAVPRPPTSGLVEGIDGALVLAPPDPSTGLPPAVPEPPSSGPASGPSTPSPSSGATQSTGAPAGSSAPQSVRSPATGTTLGPATGPTPTSAPQQPSPTVPCPSDAAPGLLHHSLGRLHARHLVLPSPGPGPLVLVPQVLATRPAGAAVRIQWASEGLVGGGSTLTVVDRSPTWYRLEAGGVSADGLITFTPLGATAEVQHQACRDRSLVVHAVAPTRGPSQLRIVGYLGPADGTITIDEDGGAAHFRSSVAGVHQVTLLTANDAGVAGPVVRATITVS